MNCLLLASEATLPSKRLHLIDKTHAKGGVKTQITLNNFGTRKAEVLNSFIINTTAKANDTTAQLRV